MGRRVRRGLRMGREARGARGRSTGARARRSAGERAIVVAAADLSGTAEVSRRVAPALPFRLGSLLWPAGILEAFLLALVAVAPLGSLSFSVSPLARAWPWLLWPGRVLFGELPVTASVPPDRGWPALALFAALLVGASGAQGLALLAARHPAGDGGDGRGAHAPEHERRRAKSRLAAMGVRTARPSGREGRWRALVTGLRSQDRLLFVVMAATLVFGVTLLLLPSLPSDDVFSYTLYGRISVVHHANPLVATPSDFPNDPFLSLVFWRDVRSVYGPVWLMLSSGISLLAQGLGGSLFVYVLLFKLLGLATHLINALLIWVILGWIAPRRQLLGTLLYAWNPLCLLEFCASAHNDALMLLFLLLGVYLLVRGWEVAALMAFGLSISTKYVPLILLPFYLVYVGDRLRHDGMTWARVTGALAGRIATIAAIMALTAIPYWAGPQTLGALLFSPPAQQLNNSLHESISWPLRWLAQGMLHLSTAAARALVDTSLKVGALVIFVVLWLRELRRARSLEGMLAAWGWALLWYVLVASGWFWPWYVTWALAVVALLEPRRLTIAALLTAGGALTLYAFLPLHASPLYGYRSVVAFGPVLGYLAITAWRRRSALFPPETALWRTLARRALAARNS